MTSYIFQKIAERGKQSGINTQNVEESKKWFMNQAKGLKDLTAREVMAGKDAKYLSRNKVQPTRIGTMLLYLYNPKWKQKLPYYDRFPCIFVLDASAKYFYGLNLHYLSPYQRAKLMNALYTTNQSNRTDKYKLRITYEILKNGARMSAYKPCLKKYLNTHVQSKFYVVPPDEWDFVAMLPTEQFEQGGAKGGTVGQPYSKHKVWADSLSKL